jgi:hypothetical protein
MQNIILSYVKSSAYRMHIFVFKLTASLEEGRYDDNIKANR